MKTQEEESNVQVKAQYNDGEIPGQKQEIQSQEQRQEEEAKQKEEHAFNEKQMQRQEKLQQQGQQENQFQANQGHEQNQYQQSQHYSQQEEEEPEVVPNFQNQQQLQILDHDQKNHKNLFDHRDFQAVQEPASPKKIQRSQSFFSKQYQNLKEKLHYFLIPAYYQYVLQAQSKNQHAEIFDKKEIFLKKSMNLTLFLKFYKDFQIKERIFLKPNDISKIFKKYAINHLWLDINTFLEVCSKIVQTKLNQNTTSKEFIEVSNEQQLIKRAHSFIEAFDKQKVRKWMKINSKQQLNQILEQYKNRQNHQTVQKPHENKGEVVDKFLERNFDHQLHKWYERKQLHPQIVSKSRVQPNLRNNKPSHKSDSAPQNIHASSNKNNRNTRQKKSQGKKRDQGSISTNIQRLRSQSEKSIKVLRSLFDQKFDQQLRQLEGEKIESQDSTQLLPLSPSNSISKKPPLHKNKHKNTVSAYKQIEQFMNENLKIMKSEKNLLGKELRINEDQPFLSAYFSRQLKAVSNASKVNTKGNNNKLHGITEKQIEKKLILLGNIGQKKSRRQANSNQTEDKLPSLKKSPSSSPVKKFSVQHKINQQKINANNEKNLLKSLQKLDQIRKSNSISSPSNQVSPSVLPKRIQSMKRIIQNNVNANKKNNKINVMSPSSQNSKISKSQFKRVINSLPQQPLLSQVQTDLINKKLFDFLQKNKQQPNVLLGQQKLNKNQNPSKNPLLVNQLSSSPGQSKQQNFLMQNYRQEVYELFKNFSKRGGQEDQIITYENEKRKGYLKNNPSQDNVLDSSRLVKK